MFHTLDGGRGLFVPEIHFWVNFSMMIVKTAVMMFNVLNPYVTSHITGMSTHRGSRE